MLAAPIVEAEHDVALLCHPDVPTPCAPMGGGIDVVGMGPSIDIDDGGVFLCGVEVGREDEAIIEVCHSIGSLDCAYFDFWHLIFSPRIFSRENVGAFPVGS